MIDFPALFMLIAMALLTLGASAGGNTRQLIDDTGLGLFTGASTDSSLLANDNPASIRMRHVNVNLNILGGSDGPDLSTRQGKSLILSPFDDVRFVAAMDKLHHNPSGSYTWIGHIQDIPMSLVILVVRDGAMYGTISAVHHGEFIVEPDGLGGHRMLEVDDSRLDPGEDDFRIPRQVKSIARGNQRAAEDGSLIDLLVVYDQDATGGYGSISATDAQNYAEQWTAYTNQVYENSGITQRLWLVDVEGYNYNRTDPGTLYDDLDNISPSAPWFPGTPNQYPDVTPHRDDYHADLVMFFLPPEDPNSCSGLAWLQSTVSAGFEDFGFASMEVNGFCKSVYAHELGHNMGARHDWYVDDTATNSPYSYAHGYIDTTNQWRTIMSYSSRCTALGIDCPRVPHFSNPNVSRDGAPTGVSSSGPTTGCGQGVSSPPAECRADVRLTFNNTAGNISGFRSSELRWTGGSGANWGTAGNWTINTGVPGSTTPTNRVPRGIDNLLIENGLGTYPIISSGTPEAREVLIESGATLNMTGGILNVGWRWEDNGGLTGAGGTIVFGGPLGVNVTSGSSSTFNNVQIGDGGSTTTVTVNSNLDINGNVLIQPGADFEGGGNTIRVAGDWTDNGTSFVPGAGTVIFDGTTQQTMDKATSTSTLLDEDFQAYTGSCCTSVLPDGWATADGSWYQGDMLAGGVSTANRWRNQTDAYLFSSALSMKQCTSYQLDYKYAARQNYYDGDGTLSTQTFHVVIATAQTSASVAGTIGTAVTSAGTTLAGDSKTFTLNGLGLASGTYYIGFRAMQTGDDYGIIDDVILTGSRDLTFYNLQIDGNSMTGTNVNTVVLNILTVCANGSFTLSNNGAMLTIAD